RPNKLTHNLFFSPRRFVQKQLEILMKKYILASLIAILATSAFAGVNVTSPGSGTTAQSPIHYVATATTGCSKGVSAMDIYTAPNVLAYTVNGASLNTKLNLSAGTYNTMVQEWDNCGGAAKTPVTITVGSGSGSGGSTFANLHQKNGWTGYALEPPSYNICGSCKPGGPQTTW